MKDLFLCELYFSFKQRSLIVLSLLAISYGFLIHIQDIGEGMQHIAVNSSYRISYFLTLTSVLFVYVSATLCINTFLKDKEKNFDQIIHAVGNSRLIKSRILVVLLNTLLVSVSLLLGMLIALIFLHFNLTDISPKRIISFSILTLLWPWVIIALPNVIFVTTLLSWVTLKWKNAKLTYIASFIIFLCFWLSLVIINAPITGESVLSSSILVDILAVLDPFASTAFFEQSQFWTTPDKASKLLTFNSYFALNRFLVVGMSLCLFRKLMVTKTTLTLGQCNTIKSLKSTKLESERVVYKPAQIEQIDDNLLSKLKITILLIKFEAELIVNSWPTRILFILWAVMITIGILMVTGIFSSGEFSGRYATSANLINQSGEIFGTFCSVVLVLVIADKIWLARDHKFCQMISATKVSSFNCYITKVIAITLVPMAMISLLIILCVAFQLFFDKQSINATQINWSHYFSLYYYLGLPQFLNIILIFSVQTVIAQLTNASKYIAMLVSALVLIFCSVFLSDMGINHPLLLINQFPDMTRSFSDLSGYGQFADKFNWLTLYWFLFAVIITIPTLLIWQKKSRIPPRNTRAVIIMIMMGGPTILMLGTAINITTLSPIRHDAMAPSKQLKALAEYELKYNQYGESTIPQIMSTKMEVDIFPLSQHIIIKSRNVIINNTNGLIEKVFITAKKELSQVSITGSRVLQKHVTPFWSVYIFELESPLQPGQKINFDYSLRMRSTPFAINHSVTSNGSYFNQGDFEPLLGYAKLMEIEDNHQRQQLGLSPKTNTVETDYKRLLGYGRFVTDKRLFEAVVSTDKSQTAITSGELVKFWQEDERNYFHYQLSQTIYPLVGYFSAEYKTKVYDIDGIKLSISFINKHDENIDEMAKATRATFKYMQQHFGSYPYRYLRLIEVPKHHPFGGKASAGTVAMNETLYLQNYKDGASINNVARNTIHEVVHQWFGEKLVPKITYGEKVLTESITKAIESTVLGQMYGEQMFNSLMEYNKRRYMSGRTFTHKTEVPLLHTIEEAFLTYGKGPLVFHLVRKDLGNKKYYATLNHFIEKHEEAMTGTLDDLVEMFVLESVNPMFIRKLFEEVDMPSCINIENNCY